jgi:hypothetical protein
MINSIIKKKIKDVNNIINKSVRLKKHRNLDKNTIRSIPIPKNKSDVDAFLDDIFSRALDTSEIEAHKSAAKKLQKQIKGGHHRSTVTSKRLHNIYNNKNSFERLKLGKFYTNNAELIEIKRTQLKTKNKNEWDDTDADQSSSADDDCGQRKLQLFKNIKGGSQNTNPLPFFINQNNYHNSNNNNNNNSPKKDGSFLYQINSLNNNNNENNNLNQENHFTNNHNENYLNGSENHLENSSQWQKFYAQFYAENKTSQLNNVILEKSQQNTFKACYLSPSYPQVCEANIVTTTGTYQLLENPQNQAISPHTQTSSRPTKMSLSDIQARAKTIRIGKVRWPPPLKESETFENEIQRLLLFF